MASSLVKFANRAEHAGSGKRLFWERADIDGLPYRGQFAPHMPEEEYEQRVVRVADARNGFFDTAIPDQNKVYLDVLECCQNGWYQLIHLERFWRQTTSHYVEWFEYYMEDGTRAPYLSAQVMEMAHGRASLFPPPQLGDLQGGPASALDQGGP